MIKALKKSENPEAKEYLKRFFGTKEEPKYDFKPFDKVLVRKEGNKKWNISLFAREIVDDYMDELNKAFTYVSASPLSSTWYWSSTESSQAVAWYVVFSSGLTGTGNKHIGDMVRAVIDF